MKKYKWLGEYNAQVESTEWYWTSRTKEIAGYTLKAVKVTPIGIGLRIVVQWGLPNEGVSKTQYRVRILSLKNNLER